MRGSRFDYLAFCPAKCRESRSIALAPFPMFGRNEIKNGKWGMQLAERQVRECEARDSTISRFAQRSAEKVAQSHLRHFLCSAEMRSKMASGECNLPNGK